LLHCPVSKMAAQNLRSFIECKNNKLFVF
jgi:hypothetical protein